MPVSDEFRRTPISALVRRPLNSVGIDTTLRAAVQLLREENVRYIGVLEGTRLAGMLTERDLVKRAYGSAVGPDTPVSEVMNASPRTLHPQDSLQTALDLLDRERYRHVALVDDRGRPHGVVTIRGIMQFLAESMPETVLNLPPDPTKAPSTAEGA
jgi:CBS domain-containing protein